MQILMPKVGLTMTEGTLVQWHKAEGEFVAKGDVLFTFETEKSTLEFESPAEGALTHILFPAGQTVVCLVPVAEVGVGDQKSRVTSHESGPEVISHKSGGRDTHSDTPLSPQSSVLNTSRRPMSPRARMQAEALQVDIDTVIGSGPDGAVRERDVLAASAKLKVDSKKLDVRATPVAQRIAAQLGIDLTQIRGTGRNGEITREDVEQAGREAKDVERGAWSEFGAPPATHHETPNTPTPQHPNNP